MANEEKIFTIVVGIDFSELSDSALDHAIELAGQRPESELHVLHVDDHLRTSGSGVEGVEAQLARIERHAQARVEALARQAGKRSSLRRLYSHYRVGSAADQIVQLAADLDADVVVVGTNGRRGVQRLLIGSVAERVVRLARCPVWVVRPKDHEGLGKVPEIEPPCADCLKKRAETQGEVFWCERHAERHVRAHHYSYAGGSGGGTDEAYASTPQS